MKLYLEIKENYMDKRIYISADYDQEEGDTEVVIVLNNWAESNNRIISFVDMAKVVSGSVSKSNSDCRPCDLKKEFNSQINASSIVVFVVGNRTKDRKSGSSCTKCGNNSGYIPCTPYKQNTNGQKLCKINGQTHTPGPYEDVGIINSYSYLKHEFEQAKKKDKEIVIFYNSSRTEAQWLPDYMKGYEDKAVPFWYYEGNNKKANYKLVKDKLGYE